MDTKNLVISLVTVVIAVGASVLLGGTDTVREIQNVVEKPVSLGGVASPDIMSPYFSFGGVKLWAAKQEMGQATTTICAMQSPSATSTLLNATLAFEVASTTASKVTIAKATTAFATTTAVGDQINIAASAQKFIVASSTQTADNMVFAPGTWLVVGMQGGVGTMSPVGTCEAIWQDSGR
jgi:hypothetical protein